MPNSSTEALVAALAEVVRIAAREGAALAMEGRPEPEPSAQLPLIDKKGLAHVLGVSTATVDRLCREGRIPFVRVGEIRRFDLAAVRRALQESASKPTTVEAAPGAPSTPVPQVRLLTRVRRG